MENNIVNRAIREELTYSNQTFPISEFIDYFDTFADKCFPSHWHDEFELQIILKGSAERPVLLADGDGGTAVAVPGGVDAFRRQQENGHGTLDLFLCQFQTFNKGICLTDDGADQLGCIDLTAAHFHEMNMPFLKCFLNQLFFIIDLADCGDGIAS